MQKLFSKLHSMNSLSSAVKTNMQKLQQEMGELQKPGNPPLSSALSQIGARNIILLGSLEVASGQVEQDLIDLVGSAGSVERVWGPDRYATQMAVYGYGVAHGLWTGDTVVVANATGFADALSVSPISYKLKAPVFYVDGTTNLPAEQKEAIRAAMVTATAQITYNGGGN